MYLWNINSLKESIRNGSFGEKDTFLYILIYVVLNALAYESTSYFPSYENKTLIDHAGSFIYTATTIIGTFLAYRANNGAAGRNFAGKYFSICFVVAIRAIALLLPVMFLWIFYYVNSGEPETTSTSIIEIIISIAIYLLIWWRVIKHIKDVSNA